MNDTHMPGSRGPVDPNRTIGEIIREAQSLTADQIDKVVAHQREHNTKFGESVVALGYASREDVLWALSQQFDYPYTTAERNFPELVVAARPFCDESETFRDLRSQFMATIFNPEGKRKALAVVSQDVGDGKSFFAANLAVVFSQLGGRTLLVDGDMRTPRLHEVFGINSGTGLSSVLSGRTEPNVISPVQDLPNLYLLPVGVTPPNPLELLQRPAFGFLMGELLSKFDYVFVDTPAAVHGADARVIASVCGAAVIIGRRGKTLTSPLKTLAASLQKTRVDVAGLIFNEI